MHKKLMVSLIAAGIVCCLAIFGVILKVKRQKVYYDMVCRNAMGSLASQLPMYEMMRGGKMPPNLDALVPDCVPGISFFCRCRYSGNPELGLLPYDIEYLTGLSTDDCLPDSIILFCKQSHRGIGRNVLFWPPRYFKANSKEEYPGLITEADFQGHLHRMLDNEDYRKQYTPEAIQIMESYIEK